MFISHLSEFLGIVILPFGSGRPPVYAVFSSWTHACLAVHKVVWGHRSPVSDKPEHTKSVSTLLLQFSGKTSLLFSHPGVLVAYSNDISQDF